MLNNPTGKKYRSWRRAERRGHLSLHVERTKENIIYVMLVRNRKRFGEPNKQDVYMVVDAIKGDPGLAPKN